MAAEDRLGNDARPLTFRAGGTGFRGMNVYETKKLVDEYMLFHYGAAGDVMPYPSGPGDAVDYAVRCVTENLDADALPEAATALDVGCAVGRSTFELARHCAQCVGIDYSAAFIAAANNLKARGEAAYAITESGSITREAIATVPAAVDPLRVSFEVGDAQELRADLGAFDVVLAANLICRLERPRAFLERLPGLVKPGGQLILSTPLTWLEEYTRKANWVGATPETGPTLGVLRRDLEEAFDLKATRDMPFLIREHARKFQWSVALATVWVRK